VVLLLSACRLSGGGSGLNVAVVVNQNSTNSVQLGNYYCERRGVPPQNVLRMTNWTGGNVMWTESDYSNNLFNPLCAMLSSRQLTNQIDYVVLSMDIPYCVTNSTGAVNDDFNSTTAVLFYGFKNNPLDPAYYCTLADNSSSAYAGSEGIFRSTSPGSDSTSNFLAVMITSSNLAQAQAIVDNGVASDGSFPTQTVYLAKSTDVLRNVRYVLFDNAIFNTRLRGNYSMVSTNSNSPYGQTNMLGYQNGLYQFSILPNSFIPGAMADSLTSFGGVIFEQNDHTILLVFLNAGASGSYGTVYEPCNYLEKFPSPQNYFFQARGFSLAECYYQSVTNPYMGLIVGEPLAAPFAKPASGAWNSLPINAILAGTTNLFLQFAARDAQHPVQQVDLFLDGTWVQTLTNIAPYQNNQLYVVINGCSTNYSVAANATIESVASDLTALLNSPGFTNITKVRAFAHGDRIELQSSDLNTPGSQIPVTASNSIGTATELTAFISAISSNFLDTIACGVQNYVVTNAVQDNSFLQLTVTKTNGDFVSLSVTNAPGNTNTSTLVQALVNAVNANASLTSPDGIVAEDFISYDLYYGIPGAEFNLRACSPGWPESQIQIALAGSANLAITPSGTNRLDANLSDLQPRNHLYISAGVTNLAFSFPFNTTTSADGYHELTAVAYEGSHVRTQARVAQNVVIQNTPLTATFTCTPCGTNTAVEATMQFSVVANTTNVTKIELFSTGGSLGAVSNQPSATFSVIGTNLDIGLHPFYVIVTRSDGKQYRTQTKWIRLIGAESPFPLSIAAPPPTLSWPATAGRRYDVLSADVITNTFQVCGTITPGNDAAQWTDTNATSSAQYYRVRTE
jgi:uncharacterized protein (TIGR03790 family)